MGKGSLTKRSKQICVQLKKNRLIDSSREKQNIRIHNKKEKQKVDLQNYNRDQ